MVESRDRAHGALQQLGGYEVRVAIDGTIPMTVESGSFRYLAELIKGLDELESQSNIVVLVTPASVEQLTDRIGSPHNVELLMTVPATSMRARLDVVSRAVDKLSVDVLHSPAYFVPWRSTTSTIVTIHDLNFLFRFGDWRRARHSFRAARLAAHFARLAVSPGVAVVPSNRTLRQVQTLAPRLAKRTSVIPWAPFNTPQTPPIGFAPRDPLVLSVGALAPQKNLETAIRAFASAYPALPVGSRYLLVGRDETNYWPQHLATVVRDTGLEDVITYEGQVSESRLHDLYRTARVLMFVSRGEGFGFPAVEALAHGLPTIGSFALAEATHGAAVLVDHRDTQSMVTALVTLMNHEDTWCARSRCGLLEIGRRSWKDVATEHLVAYALAARTR
jgi:glycosyltransferase involved in cell wall biosynthesis